MIKWSLGCLTPSQKVVGCAFNSKPDVHVSLWWRRPGCPSSMRRHCGWTLLGPKQSKNHMRKMIRRITMSSLYAVMMTPFASDIRYYIHMS